MIVVQESKEIGYTHISQQSGFTQCQNSTVFANTFVFWLIDTYFMILSSLLVVLHLLHFLDEIWYWGLH